MSKWGQEGDKWCPENDRVWQIEQSYKYCDHDVTQIDPETGKWHCIKCEKKVTQ